MNNSTTIRIKEVKRFYVSGKISGIKIENAKQNFHFACKEVVKFHEADYVINPFDIKPLFGIRLWLFFMIADLWKLRKCTHIAMQKNWIDSKGAWLEYGYAKFILKIPVIFL